MSARLRETTVVVPCYNEERRLVEDEFVSLARRSAMNLLFVDDGSTDKTSAILDRMAIDTDAIQVLRLESNKGKAEAVRCGLLLAIRQGASVVGYFDADLATPSGELERLSAIMDERRALQGAFGSRIACLGSSIDRTLKRHYAGRAYATLAALALGTSVYDTQCGAKLFRVTPSLLAALSEPFRSSWSFDVELLDRLLRGSDTARPVSASSFVEVPLEMWRDVGGSKLRPTEATAAFIFLASMALRRLGARGKRKGRRDGGAVLSALQPRPSATEGGAWRSVEAEAAGLPVIEPEDGGERSEAVMEGRSSDLSNGVRG